MSLFSTSKAPPRPSVSLRKRAKSALSSNLRYTYDHDDESFVFSEEELDQKSIFDECSVNGSNSGESRTVKNLDAEPSARSSEPIVISDAEPDEDSSCDRASLEQPAVHLTSEIEGSINRGKQVPSFRSDDEDEHDAESSEDLGFTDTILKRIERRQLDLLRKLAEKRTPRAIKKTRRGRPTASRDQFETIEDCWEAYLEDVPKNFSVPRKPQWKIFTRKILVIHHLVDLSVLTRASSLHRKTMQICFGYMNCFGNVRMISDSRWERLINSGW